MKKDEIPEADKKEKTEKQCCFKHTYVGELGVFYQGKSYPLTEELRRNFYNDIEIVLGVPAGKLKEAI
jgi:hypothetical protein